MSGNGNSGRRRYPFPVRAGDTVTLRPVDPVSWSRIRYAAYRYAERHERRFAVHYHRAEERLVIRGIT